MTTDKNLWLRPLSGPEEAEQLQAEAKADAHEIIFPRFVLTRTKVLADGQEEARIIGGVGAWPVWQAWLHTKHCKPRDTIRALAQLEARVRNSGVPVCCLPCTKESPLRGVMDRLGYAYGWETGLFFKQL